jgi:hypothetical protein
MNPAELDDVSKFPGQIVLAVLKGEPVLKGELLEDPVVARLTDGAPGARRSCPA